MPEFNKSAWALLTLAATVAVTLAATGCTPPPEPAAPPAPIVRHPIPGSDFPISLAVEVPADKTLVFVSGLTPDPADPAAEQYSPAYWGDTKAQSLSVLKNIEEALQAAGLTMKDVVKMQAFLVGTPDTGKMDFAGFMEAYRSYFGTAEQPNLPTRTTVQIAALGRPGMLVEIEVIAAK